MLQILRIIKILNSDTSPSAIASAICLALFIGLTPIMSPHNLIIFLAVLVFRVHLGTFILACVGFALIGLAFETPIEQFGLAMLENQSLQTFWTSVYNSQAGRLSFFNYTTTMGGLFISLIAFIPMWVFSVIVINQYRSKLMSWVQHNKLVQLFKGSALIQLYNKSMGE